MLSRVLMFCEESSQSHRFAEGISGATQPAGLPRDSFAPC